MISSPSMGPAQRHAAIILRTRAYGESDKIVTFLTDTAGKLTGIAKGAKRSRRRFANCLDPFTRVQAHFRVRPGASLVFLESCDLIRPPGPLTDPVKFAYGSYLIELVDQLTAEAHPVCEVYDLLAEALDGLRDGAATAGFLRAFELRLLRHAGYDPQLHSCGRCHQPLLATSPAFLDPVQASVVCADCRASGQTVIPVAGQTLAALEAMKTASLDDARDRRFTAATTAEAANFMGRVLALHLSRPLRSIKLIAALSA